MNQNFPRDMVLYDGPPFRRCPEEGVGGWRFTGDFLASTSHVFCCHRSEIEPKPQNREVDEPMEDSVVPLDPRTRCPDICY